MFLLDQTTVVYSASDLTAAASCEWATMHRLDAILGRVAKGPKVEDAMLTRTGKLGDAHEKRVLDSLKKTRQVVEIERPERVTDVAVAASLTQAAFEAGAEVIFQAAFFDGRFLGYADFIIRTETRTDTGTDTGTDTRREIRTETSAKTHPGDIAVNGPEGSGYPAMYEVYDTKLARHSKITALLQLAAYSEQLQRLGVPTGELVHLWLGDGQLSSHRLRDILPVYRRRRARLERIIDERVADTTPIEWGDDRFPACGHCEACAEEIAEHRDVLQVAGLRLTQRARLRAAGISTIDELAASHEPVDGLSRSTLSALRMQAQLQLEPTSAAHPLAWKVIDAQVLAALPAADAGDIFFDFEGDPLHQEGVIWGLDYLFGLVDVHDTFTALWAHTLAEEKQALTDFIAVVTERRQRHPNLHIYHYASYERTHLQSLAARHGVGEEAIAEMMRAHVLVDLYPIVRRSILIGCHSYSLKKLEPLYMGDAEREGVANAGDSITEYVRSRELFETGQTDAAAQVTADIARYNTYDCISTLRLRDWLLARAAENAVPHASVETLFVAEQQEADPLYARLMALIDRIDALDRTPDQQGIALAAAALDYYRRENNSFWWEHYDRLREPIEEWEDTRDVFRVDVGAVVERDWSKWGKDRSKSRDLWLTGTLAAGSSLTVDQTGSFVVYENHRPSGAPVEPGARWAHNKSSVLEIEETRILVREKVAVGGETTNELPIALTPSPPPRAGALASAIHDWAQEVFDAAPVTLADPAMDVLRREPPRTVLPPAGKDVAAAILTALLRLDRSYVAVQGPPGTGKTHVGSNVIASLVRDHGWKIGVVGQSHAVVEHMLDAVVAAGLDPAMVGKKPHSPGPQVWTELTETTQTAFTDQPAFVIGGTAWTFANKNRIGRRSLDLLVVDEAGQYSLANTIAASVSAERLLLLGDPQQLPQVTKGTHPEPVDTSALGWLSAGHDVLPPEFGYFLDTSWRMHPDVCAPVSRLSYEGKLTSHPSDRHLAEVAPGLRGVPLEHFGNATSSTEEAAGVTELVANLLGRAWSSGGSTAALRQADIIVVAPYNAQVELVGRMLAAAGFDEVPVGTVDKFQGREAAVSIITLAASSAADVPRGLEFLLLANRLNVAISRAQWASYLIYSPGLVEALPTSIAGLAQLSAFIELVNP